MKAKNTFAALLLLVAGLQTAWGQGFRVYKSDGTVAQFSLRTDSIVFYDGIGSDVDFGPFTPVNQMIVGTWYKTKSETITFNEDGTTDYVEGATYNFLPYQGTIVIYNAAGVPVNIYKVHNVADGTMIVSTLGSETFSVWSGTKPQPQPVVDDEHEWVDLGLPSGTLWATCNVGASKPEEYGDYFAWGETEPKEDYSWSTYKWCNGAQSTLTKYCTSSSYGTVDNKIELEAGDDAATVHWGSNWQMPSVEQIEELISGNYTTISKITQDGVYGCKITSSSNGNSIFFPAGGLYGWSGSSSLTFVGTEGHYWSRTLSTSNNNKARRFSFDWGDHNTEDNRYRNLGVNVRPVRKQ